MHIPNDQISNGKGSYPSEVVEINSGARKPGVPAISYNLVSNLRDVVKSLNFIGEGSEGLQRIFYFYKF